MTAFAVGKNGSTLRKLQRASGALLVYLGTTALLAGSKAQRDCLRLYLELLLGQWSKTKSGVKRVVEER